MDINRNYLFMTTNQQKIMLYMYPSLHITFKAQTIYSNQQHFRKAMRQLINFGKVERLTSVKNDMRENGEIYYLNIWGKIHVEKNIIKFNDVNA